jgi:hypothetical protein
MFVGMGAIVGTALLLVLQSSQPGLAQGPTIITQPSEWIPLTATYTISQREPLAYTATDVEYVSSDGSRRRDVTGGPMDTRISIDNIRKGEHYSHRRGVWTVHPLRVQPNGGKPALTLSTKIASPVASSDERVRDLRHLNIRFYETNYGAPGQGVPMMVVSPDLNFREVYRLGASTYERRLVSLTFGEPHIDFEPPTGVSLVVSNVPSGYGLATEGELDRIQQIKAASR